MTSENEAGLVREIEELRADRDDLKEAIWQHKMSIAGCEQFGETGRELLERIQNAVMHESLVAEYKADAEALRALAAAISEDGVEVRLIGNRLAGGLIVILGDHRRSFDGTGATLAEAIHAALAVAK